MCGICGVVGDNIKEYKQENVIKKMIAPLDKRGPDDKGQKDFENCILGQTRLSIIDLVTGSQPMKDNQADVWIVFNGEIYNYVELKQELIKGGYNFSTKSDTEVILKTYLEYSFECPEHLNGMFAFAIWDERKKVLFMARDRFGQKPLFYTFDKQDNLLFASEIKSLLASGKVKGQLDYRTLDNYLSLLYIPPYKTIFSNIHVLKPGHLIIYKGRQINEKKYWEVRFNSAKISKQEAQEELRRLLEEGVKLRMRADVPLGVFLSGGIDSTIITYLMQKNSSKKINTFSAGFEHYINELPFANEVAERLDTNHHEIQIRENLIENLLEVTKYYDEPFADSSNIPTYLISKYARQNMKVALGGDGGDELFLGYGWYEKFLNPSPFQKIKGLFTSPHAQYFKNIQYFPVQERKNLWQNSKYVNQDFIESNLKDSASAAQKINYFDLNVYLPGDILTKLDRSSMMTSLELRSPFLDYYFAEFIFNLPLEYKFDGNRGKIILIDAFKDILPSSINRKKQGFGAPVHKWLEKDDLKKFVLDIFNDQDLKISQFLIRKQINALVDRFYSEGGRKYMSGYKIWILLCLELWFRNYEKYIEI